LEVIISLLKRSQKIKTNRHRIKKVRKRTLKRGLKIKGTLRESTKKLN